MNPLDRIVEALAAREAAGLRRHLTPRQAREATLDLAGNDYLGLTHDPRVTAAAAAAALDYGAGSTGSRLVTGTTQLHADLETSLAQFTGAEAGLVFSSGYLANLAALTALAGPDVTIVSDAGNHASVIDGCRLSGATIAVVPHADLAKFEAALASADTEHTLLVTDGVFSVDGDLADISALHGLARRHGAILVVDEAHALGVVGPGGVGSVARAGLAGAPDIVQTVTLSKSLGAQGGAVLGARAVIELLISTARPFIFDTGLAPASVGAAQAALQILIDEPWRAAAVRSHAVTLAELVGSLGVETAVPDAAVVPAVLGDPLRAVDAAAAALDLGVRVGCFRPPAVPPGRSCLRLTSRADLTERDIARAGQVLAAVLA
jgi:8-amino-7-oxononanoate synthase